MSNVEYKPARREWIREILIDIVAGVVSSVLLTALTAVANLLF
ncbi:DUF6408 family protein [Streptomyces sp. NPDC051555]